MTVPDGKDKKVGKEIFEPPALDENHFIHL
jgi:hypothetical protein